MHRPMDTIQPSQCTQSSSADSGIVQLTRITHAPRDQGEAQSLASKDGVARSYDIVAINPKNERLMQQVGL